MPKYKDAPVGVKGWVFLAVILGVVLYFIWLAPYLLLLVPIYVAIDIYDKKKRNKHFKRLLQDREDDSICTFSRYFEYRKIDTWIIRAVYEQLQTYMITEKENFPIRPTDDVFIDLMIDDEDFEYDLLEEIAQRTGRSLENTESNPFYGKANIVENLVYFFNEQPKANET
jgi:hypothetical protein